MEQDSPSSDTYLNRHCNHLRGDLMYGAIKKHPERSEESEYMLTGAYQILRFAQDDIMMKITDCAYSTIVISLMR